LTGKEKSKTRTPVRKKGRGGTLSSFWGRSTFFYQKKEKPEGIEGGANPEESGVAKEKKVS